MTGDADATTNVTDRLPLGLLVLRLALGLFVLQWTVEKFINPVGMTRIFDHFYGIDLAVNMPMVIGGLELIIVLAFLAGAYKRVTYGLLFLFHAGSTLSSYDQLLHPFDGSNHLFTAAVPVLAAFCLLYLARESDTMWSWDARRAASAG